MNDEILEIVDDDDKVIGTKSRRNIHQEGLLHREIHVWFYTPKGEIIFQHRAKNKDTYPDLLDATVGGHVEVGDTYEQTAIKEVKEETGLDLKFTQLHFLKKINIRSEDLVTHTINHAFKSEYAYLFLGTIDELVIEKDKALGFELWSIANLLAISEEDKKKFVPTIFSPKIIGIFEEIKRLV